MKIRKTFVTNSSSSSYVCIYKLNCDRDTITEEFGKFGTIILDNYAVTSIDQIIKESLDGDNYYFEYQIENAISDICADCECECKNEEDSDCSIVKDQLPDLVKEIIEKEFCKFEDGKVYLIGYASQGYGGEWDVSDDDDVMLGKLLQNRGLATCEYMGDPN